MSVIDLGHARLMDGVYARQRHIYDATRRYYLLGRDTLLHELDPPLEGSVLEVGCGTGRNLFALADRHPGVRLYGFDVSTEMLATALERALRHPRRGAFTFAHADAATFDPLRTFGVSGFERVFFSYTLSMIPAWREALAKGFEAVLPGGSLHVVDFGQQERLPHAFRAALTGWLGLFHATPRRELREAAVALAEAKEARLDFRRLHGGYAWSLTLSKPSF
ncbi:MAG: trans-aconitate 2-methyltransferase [Parvibaculaceae bacterium]